MINKFDLITLMQLNNIGSKTVIQLHEEIQNQRLINLNFNDYIFMLKGKFNKKNTKEEIDKAKLKSENILESCYLENIKIISFLDSNYPKRFEKIKIDKPALLYTKGNTDIMKEGYNLAVIGSRKASEEGIEIGYSYAKKAAEYGFNIISGLALGCDTSGHRGVLASNKTNSKTGRTLAVLPSGIKNIYPNDNEGLALEILKSKGCLISEKSPGEPPEKYDYILRDRLQAALSEALLIIESRLNGGTSHTAKYGIKYNKKLMCIGINLKNKGMELNKKLIENKDAVKINNKKDFVDILIRERNEHSEISHQ